MHAALARPLSTPAPASPPRRTSPSLDPSPTHNPPFCPTPQKPHKFPRCQSICTTPDVCLTVLCEGRPPRAAASGPPHPVFLGGPWCCRRRSPIASRITRTERNLVTLLLRRRDARQSSLYIFEGWVGKKRSLSLFYSCFNTVLYGFWEPNSSFFLLVVVRINLLWEAAGEWMRLISR